MKNALLLLMTAMCLAVAAQDDSADKNKKKEEKQHAENEPRDRIVMGFGFDNWIYDRDKLDSLKTKWNSWGFHLYYMYDVPLGRSRFSFAPGLGFRASWVKNNSYLDDSGDSTLFRPLDTIEYKRNSLAISFFDIPLELRYRSKPGSKNKSFKLAIGCIGGIQIGNHTSTKADLNGDTKVVRVKRWDDLARFQFGPTFRIGFGSINLFVYYAVTNLFRKDKGPQVRPFSAGFSINAL